MNVAFIPAGGVSIRQWNQVERNSNDQICNSRYARSGVCRVRMAASGDSGGRPPMPPEAVAAARAGERIEYWQGEWICVDCGYIYKPNRKVKFEDLPSTWKCPQCSAPKRRFAKKAGSFIQETETTSNLPIIIFSIFGLVATIAFGVWASANL